MIDPAQVVSGFAVGAIVGVTGVGGGSLMTPILVLLFGIHPATAVGTDLLHAAISKSGGTYVHAKAGRVDWRITALLAAGSLPAAVATLLALHYLTKGVASSKIVTETLGIALLLTAAALVLRGHLRRFANIRAAHARSAHNGGADTGATDAGAADSGAADRGRHPAFTVITGVLLGVVVSISSVGAGALGVSALVFLYPHLKTARIVASDLAHAVPLTLIAGLGHWLFGSIDWILLGTLLIGSLPGIYLGSRLAGRVPESVLRFLLAGVLLIVGLRLIAF